MHFSPNFQTRWGGKLVLSPRYHRPYEVMLEVSQHADQTSFCASPDCGLQVNLSLLCDPPRAFSPGGLGPAPALQTLKPHAQKRGSVPLVEKQPLSAQMIASHCTGSTSRESNDVMSQRDVHCGPYKAAARNGGPGRYRLLDVQGEFCMNSGLIQSVATG